MKPARSPEPRSVKLLVVGSGEPISTAFERLPEQLRAGDLLVLNDAATLPASVQATRLRTGETLELRFLPKDPELPDWQAVLFGAGSWRDRTEDRPPPPRLEVGEALTMGRLSARVAQIGPDSSRLLTVSFDAEARQVLAELYRQGHPIQYSYLKTELDLWSVQNVYAARPWASEMPSAGRHLNWGMLNRLKAQGVNLATLTHSTGLSSTGDPVLDRKLPLPEFSLIPDTTIAAIERAREAGRRVIAVGTSVVRAIEGRAAQNGGALTPGFGRTNLVIHSGFKLRWTDAILTGVHEVHESHFQLLRAFCESEQLKQALAIAEREGYLSHEFGDSALVFRSLNF